MIGVDMTPSMLARARDNARKLGFTNVEFRLGEIEHLPVDPASVDVIISNCVLNLLPDKAPAFVEMARVLRPGGRFCVSDIVATGELPEPVRKAAGLYVGCIAGALPRSTYLGLIEQGGFPRRGRCRGEAGPAAGRYVAAPHVGGRSRGLPRLRGRAAKRHGSGDAIDRGAAAHQPPAALTNRSVNVRLRSTWEAASSGSNCLSIAYALFIPAGGMMPVRE